MFRFARTRRPSSVRDEIRSRRFACATLFFALLFQLQCGIAETSPGESVPDTLNATPDNLPPLAEGVFAPLVTTTLPDASSEHQQAYAEVDATSLMVRNAPQRDAQALQRLGNREPIEIVEETGDPLTIDGVSGRWTKIRMIVVQHDRPALLEGWVFGGYLTKNSEGEYSKAPDSGDFTSFSKIHEATRPFDPRGKTFSYGVGCSGKTFSEYGLEAKFTEQQVEVSSTNAIVHDSVSPSGKVCSTLERRMHRGTYAIKGGEIQVKFKIRQDETERFSGEPDADDCDQTTTSEKKVQLSDNYQIAYCYERGRTVPGILATIPGDDSDKIPAFWALLPE